MTIYETIADIVTQGWYRCVSDIHRKKGDFKYEKGKEQYEEGATSEVYNPGLPVVAFTLTDDFHKEFPHVKQEAVSNLLRAKQYIIPSKAVLPVATMVNYD
jgi:glutamate decarboxylase